MLAIGLTSHKTTKQKAGPLERMVHRQVAISLKFELSPEGYAHDVV